VQLKMFLNLVYIFCMISLSFANNNYLVLFRASEGISKWRYIINDVILLAIDLNRTLVEPCILNGRIEYCSDPGSYGISKVYDMEMIKRNHKNFRMINFKEYSRILKERKIHKKLCYEDQIRIFKMQKTEFKIDTQKNHVFDEVEVTDDAFEDCVRSYDKDDGVVYMYFPWYGNVLARKKATVMTFDLKFKQFHYDIVDRLLGENSIAENYVVFNWRSEVVDLNHIDKCAGYLATRSDIWAKEFKLSKKSQVLIVTDINLAGKGIRKFLKYSLHA